MSEIDIGETIKNNIDYWKNKYFQEKENTNKLIRYIALKENKDYEQVKEEFEIGG